MLFIDILAIFNAPSYYISEIEFSYLYSREPSNDRFLKTTNWSFKLKTQMKLKFTSSNSLVRKAIQKYRQTI